MIRVGYYNIRGLTPSKLQACVSLIDGGLFDLLILAEHWFPIGFPYMQHPYCFVQSKYERPDVLTGRATGGVLVLINPVFQSYILRWEIFPDAVLLSFDSYLLLGVYISPSISISQLHHILAHFPSHDVLIGDINCRFHGLAQERVSEIEVQDFWNGYMIKEGKRFFDLGEDPLPMTGSLVECMETSSSQFLRRATRQLLSSKPTHLSSHPTFELDHVFATQNFVDITELRLLNAETFHFPSDHKYIIHLIIHTDQIVPTTENIRDIVGRFFIEHLERPIVSVLLQRNWAIVAEGLETIWRDNLSVDQMDRSLVIAVQVTAEHVLGSYKADRKRKAPDLTSVSLNGTLSHVAAIQLFKRHQRSEANRSCIVATTPDGDVQTECLDKLRGQFFATNLDRDCRPTEGPPMQWESEILPLFQHSKIAEFLRSYPLQKACGNDSIHTLLIRHLLPTSFLSYLHRLFVACIETGKTPSRWNESVVYLLPKGKAKDENGKRLSPTADTVRPLSILPMFRRIFESLLIPTLTKDENRFSRLHPSQAGFRRGYSTLTNIAVCHHALNNKLAAFAIFLDFKAAYDSIDPHSVMSALRVRKTPLLLQKLIYSSMFTSGSYTAVINGVASEPQERNRGLPQGSPLSPIVFNLFIDSLVRKLNSIPNQIGVPHCLFYADDGVLLAQDVRTARVLLHMAQDWANVQGMTFNVGKCGVVTDATIAGNPLSIDNIPIPRVESYQYLGLPFTIHGIDVERHMDDCSRTVSGFIKAIQFSSNSWSSYTRWIIYTTFIRPKFEYAAPLFKCFTLARKSVALYGPMVAAERSAISWVLRCTGRTPNVDAGILGCYQIAQRFSHLRTMFQLHRLQLRQENPLVIVLKSPLGMKSDNMIRYLDSDPVYDEFTLLNPTIPLKFQKPVLRDFLLSRRKQYLQTKATTILKYIDPKSRRPSLLDCTLLAPTEYQQDFISWRRGKWLMGHKCICGKPWNRSHAEHFGTTGSLVPGGLYGKYRRTQCNYPRHYTIIDFLLNHKEFKIAFALLQDWKKRMYTTSVA